MSDTDFEVFQTEYHQKRWRNIGDRMMPVVSGENEVRTYAPKRVCEKDGCAVVLSIYNAGEKCSVHERKK